MPGGDPRTVVAELFELLDQLQVLGVDDAEVVGVVEVVAGLLVALRPQVGAYVVALWLVGIIVDLVSMGDYYDIALRDVGLLAAALALGSLAGGLRSRR